METKPDKPHVPSVELSRKSSRFFAQVSLSNKYLSFSRFFKSKKSDRSFKLYEMYRFADRYDYLLMIIGTIAGR